MSESRDYVILDHEGNLTTQEASLPPEKRATVVYRAKLIARDMMQPESAVSNQTAHAKDSSAREGNQEPLRALVLTHGKESRAMLQALVDAGIQPYVAYTRDHANASYLRAAAGKVSLGDTYSAGLFSNAYAVLNAASECNASVIFLADEAVELANVDVFIAYAEKAGIPVFKTMDAQRPSLGWVACTTTSRVPEHDEWVTCSHCGLTFSKASLAKSYYTCPTCGGYFRMTSSERISDLLDMDSFEEWFVDEEQSDPLGFPGYQEKLEEVRLRTGLNEAVCTGKGSLAGITAAFAFMEPSFLMGSMGSVVGHKIARMFDRATDEGLPAIVFCASGGARMQEGLVSLMQMAKISCAVQRHADAGLPYFSVICDPTTGGVTASFAMQADIVLAEPKALVGFAGKRVIQDTIRRELPAGFQTAEFAFDHGLVDMVVARNQLRPTLAHLLALHAQSSKNVSGCAEAGAFEGDGSREATERLVMSYEAVCKNLEAGRNTFNHITYGRIPIIDAPEDEEQSLVDIVLAKFVDRDGTSEIRPKRALGRLAERGLHSARKNLINAASKRASRKSVGSQEAWERVQVARNTHRPTSLFYIQELFDGFIEVHGDRMYADDGAIIGGIGWLDGKAVTILAQEKGRDVKERVRRNFGSPQPEGYRKTQRLMRQAEKFGRPVICFVDTQGAFCDADSEARGQGNAIAENLLLLAGLKVPVISVLLGEGGSGGALALALSDAVVMQENAVYSVLSPEGFASILWKDRTRAPEAAALMRMDASSICEMGIIDDVLDEGEGPAHENPEQAAFEVRTYLVNKLHELADVSPEELVRERHERFDRF